MSQDILKFRSRASGYAPYGVWRTKSLFDDSGTRMDQNPPEPLYTLKDYDTKYPSLKKLYLEFKDLTEYEFATKYLGGWDHWQHLLQQPWFSDHVLKWRTELELKLQAEALKRVLDEAEADGRNAFAANKLIISKGYVPKQTEVNRRGRPSKDEIRKAAAEEAFNVESVEEDLKRLDIN